MFKSIAIELMVDDVSKTLSFYKGVLAFSLNFAVPNEESPIFASIQNGSVEIMLYDRSEFAKEIPKFKEQELGGTFVPYISVDEIENLYNSVKNKVTIVQELHKTDYGSTEFSMEDINGYVLMFTQN